MTQCTPQFLFTRQHGAQLDYLVARAVIIYYGQRKPRASVSCVATWMPEGKDTMLLKSGKIVNSRPGPQDVVIKQDGRLRHSNYVSGAKRGETFKKRGHKKLQIEMETIEKLLEGLDTLVDLLISQIRTSEEVSLS